MDRSVSAVEKDAGRASAAAETKLTALKTATDAAVRRVEKVEGDSTAREAKAVAIDKKVTALETKHKPMLAEVAGLGTRMSSVEGLVSGLKTEATATKTALAATTAAAQRLAKVESDAASQGDMIHDTLSSLHPFILI